MTKYKLYYFNFRSRGEVARQLFALAGEPFEDIRVDHRDWPALKGETPFGQLPMLEINGGQRISQSITIARFLAREFGFAGTTLYEQAVVDSVADQYGDFLNIVQPFFSTLGGFQEGSWEELLVSLVRPARETFFAMMAKFLEKSPSGFLVGETVTYADLLLAEHVSTMKTYDPYYTRDWPEIQNHWSKVRAIPNLSRWIDERPDSVF